MLERIHEVWSATIKQLHLNKNANAVLMLSGGLDSRMLAGTLAHQQLAVTTYTLGASGDYEQQAAKAVLGPALTP